MHDIKTHDTLSRQGILISVARNRYGLRHHESGGVNISDDWKIERHIYKKKKPANTAVIVPPPRNFYLEKKARLHQIEVIQDLLTELQQALAEGLPVAMHEFKRLKTRLKELQAE